MTDSRLPLSVQTHLGIGKYYVHHFFKWKNLIFKMHYG